VFFKIARSVVPGSSLFVGSRVCRKNSRWPTCTCCQRQCALSMRYWALDAVSDASLCGRAPCVVVAASGSAVIQFLADLTPIRQHIYTSHRLCNSPYPSKHIVYILSVTDAANIGRGNKCVETRCCRQKTWSHWAQLWADYLPWGPKASQFHGPLLSYLPLPFLSSIPHSCPPLPPSLPFLSVSLPSFSSSSY